jgi:5-methylcytosine-specific restriction enzyme A
LIHIHHLRQLSDINAEYCVNPVDDLCPVCPTCHAVIHSRKSPYTIEEVAIMIEAQKNK